LAHDPDTITGAVRPDRFGAVLTNRLTRETIMKTIQDLTEATFLIHALLAELHYVQDTGDIKDSLRNSGELKEQAAQATGHTSFSEFVTANKYDPA
jgi:hypothetical protein